MKRKWMALFLALCMALSLCACADSGNDENSANAANAETVTAAKAVSFEATILEVYDGSVMVQPVEGSAELRSADKITFGTKNLNDIGHGVGDQVKIYYGGEIMESYPAQIVPTKWELVKKAEPDPTETSDIAVWEDVLEERKPYTGEPWINKETAVKCDDLYLEDLIITEIYTDCFFAHPLIPMPYQIKMNATLSEDWCVGDQVVCTFENAWLDESSYGHVEADMLTIEVGTTQLDPMVAYKPVIYLYPEEETRVSVRLSLDGELLCTYPAYNTGWQVTAAPDGTLTDARGQTYSYLYWEGQLRADWNREEGFCVKGSDTAAFLEDALAQLGLNRREANEFIVYWLPLMEQNPYNIITFQTEAYTDAAALHIDPVPDTLIRVFMTWESSEDYVNLKPQALTAPTRTGFTVVEWGGTQIP